MTDKSGDPGLLAGIEDLTASFAGELGVYAKNLTTGEELAYNADEVMPTASTIKVAIMAELYRQVEAGEVDLGRAFVSRRPIGTAEPACSRS